MKIRIFISFAMFRDKLQNLKQPITKNRYTPDFFRLTNANDKLRFEKLLSESKQLVVFDEIVPQVEELIKCKNPGKVFDKEILNKEALALIGTREEEFGVWVYYPWSNRLVHILDEEDFIEVRTNRNKHKITPQEMSILARKKVAIIGLSIGQSIAMTMVTERICSEMILADFDVVELSNLNRIRTGVHSLGELKVVVVAREIAEIDPFFKVQIFEEGFNEENAEDFFTRYGKVDLLVEVCDSIDIKFLSRIKAREKGIPVIMDTSDRGLIDIERFDLEPNRALFHGKLQIDDYNQFKVLSREEKIDIVLKIIDKDKVSKRLLYSMDEIGKSITTWPQLASSVVIGGGATTEIARKILLEQLNVSGRFYFDLEDIFK